MKGRVVFPKNPWPRGHAIKVAQWTGRLDPARGLVFDLHLKSADYDAESDGQTSRDESDWRSPLVWNNYGACILSSTMWANQDVGRGIVVGTTKQPLSWAALDGATLRADAAYKAKIPEGFDPAFGIYLLGHDACADHAVRFARRGATWTIDWTARIALAYAGENQLKHRLEATVRGLTFGGFEAVKGLPAAKARALFSTLVDDPAAWTQKGRRFVRGAKRTR